ncbi:hypothetical protein V8C34DRAFT_316474 [Trichoderma compactum]
MPNLFCCSSIRPYRPQRLDHDRKFDKFIQWAKSTSTEPKDDSSLLVNADYVVQLVMQANYGPKESVRCFTTANDGAEFAEVCENELIAANFEKLNSYKNFKCIAHDKFFEVNLYQQNPINRHHWRANIARPATDIDLVYRQKKDEEKSTQAVKAEDTKQENHDTDVERGGSSSSTLPDPTSQAHEAVSQFDIPALKSTNLGSNPLVSLLALDWANKELSLGLEIEDLWISKLNSDNIATFICSYVKLSTGNLTKFRVADIEYAVGYAIGCGNLLKKEKTHGRSKFQEIVENVLNLRSASDWVSKCRECILCMFTAALDERFLELGKRKEDEYQDRHIKADREEGDNDDYNQYDYNDEYEYNNTNDYNASSPDFDKDFTACDKECGYCGRCSY